MLETGPTRTLEPSQADRRDDGRPEARAGAGTAADRDTDRDADPGVRLVALWREVALRMADLPIVNPRLAVAATAFERCGAYRIGVVTTPWFMNAVAVPDDPAALPGPGLAVEVPLPEGVMDATVAELDGFGRFAAASLFSPMDDFGDPNEARGVAEAALAALLAPPAEPAPPKPPAAFAKAVDRRALLFGRRPEPQS